MWPPKQTLSEVSTLKFIRKQSKINLTEMASRMNISTQYLSEIENGKRPCTQAFLTTYFKVLED